MRHEVTLCTLDLLTNLFLASEQELKVRYGSSMQSQIERVYGLHVSAKYVALSGIKNLIYLVWMTVHTLSPANSDRQLPEEIEELTEELTGKIM